MKRLKQGLTLQLIETLEFEQGEGILTRLSVLYDAFFRLLVN